MRAIRLLKEVSGYNLYHVGEVFFEDTGNDLNHFDGDTFYICEGMREHVEVLEGEYELLSDIEVSNILKERM